MSRVFLGLLGARCFVYLDDIIFIGQTLQEHNERLREIFDRLKQFNLKIEPDKCEFLKTELRYLVTSEGVKPDPNKVRAINDIPIPKNVTDVKSFLGLAGYYRKFNPQFSEIAKPLNDLLKNNNAWIWEQAQMDSFHNLQTILMITSKEQQQKILQEMHECPIG
jgi:hypothetical protein